MSDYSELPHTDELSAELSEMLKGGGKKCKITTTEENILMRLIDNASVKSDIKPVCKKNGKKKVIKPKTISSSSSDSDTEITSVNKSNDVLKNDIYKVLKLVKCLEQEIKNLKSTTKPASNCCPNEGRICDLHNKIQDIEEGLDRVNDGHNQGEPKKEEPRSLVYCKIDQRLDSLLETIDGKFGDIYQYLVLMDERTNKKCNDLEKKLLKITQILCR